MKKSKPNKLHKVTYHFNKVGKYIFVMLLALQVSLLLSTNEVKAGPEQEDFGFWNTKWCRPTQEGVQKGSFYSPSMDVWAGYTIYLPEEYYLPENAEVEYPVVYFLHGINGQECNYLSNVEENPSSMIELVKNGTIPPTIFVMPNGGKGLSYVDAPGNCSDTKQCPETMLINELIPHIDSTYRTNEQRNGRALQGFSMGGQGTMRLGFKHNDLFCSLGVMSPAAPIADMVEIEGYVLGDGADIAANMNVKMAVGEVEGLGTLDTVTALNSYLDAISFPSSSKEISVGANIGHDLESLLAAPDTQAPGMTIGQRMAEMHWECLQNDVNDGDVTPPDPDPDPDPEPDPDPDPDPQPSTVTAEIRYRVNGPLTVQVSGRNSTSSGGTVTGYNWDFGDGNTSNGNTITHTYAAEGIYDITLVVTDSTGAQDTEVVTVSVTTSGSTSTR